jgi:hemoglobin-like flavoprotein
MNNTNAAAATTTTTAAVGDDTDAPNTANRWKIDLRNHGSKFFNSLDDLISVVDKPEELFKMLHDIGIRHKTYEVKSEHIQVCLLSYVY